MKTRFSSIDIRTTVVNLQKQLIGLRLANLYDLSPRVFLLKFSKPDCKKNLIIESGIRIHSTNFVRDKSDHAPAPFSINLRKYIKTKRLESVKQLGVDRIVDFTFGSGIAVQHLIVELYSIGNIILTDGEYKILAILRTHQHNADESVAVGDVYPVDRVKKPTEFTEGVINQIIESTQDKKETLKQVFNKSLDFGPELIEHCILSAGLQPSTKLEQYDHSAHSEALIQSFKEGQKIYDNTIQSKGYIILKDPKQLKPQQLKQQQKQSTTLKLSTSTTSSAAATDDANPEEKKELVIYEDFVPFLYCQFKARKYIEFDTFDASVDQFFSEIESQKVEQQRIAQEQVVLKKLDKVKEDQQRRIDSLFANEEENIRKAQLIEANLQEVDQCILIIRSGVAASMDWENLNQLLKEEKKKNPYSVATKIHRLKLESNQITLSLTDGFLYDDQDDDDQDDDDESSNDEDEENSEEESEKSKQKKLKKSKQSNQKPTLIDVDISLSAFANARKYYDSKKQSHEKAQKTISQAEFALRAAEKKTRQQLSETKSKNSMIAMRKIFWFEKFHWFISSDNYIVVSGRDAQQNELLYKKYLDKDDIYIHADIFGSTSCVIKNPSGGEIPPNTLIQAGTMTMCYSNAWSAKVVTSAYWVHAHQVSKTAPSGEFLTTGSFMIRGKKNYLPHSQLVMGFGFMFKIDDSCLGNHLNERKPVFALGGDDDKNSSHTGGDHTTTTEASEGGENGEKHLRKFERTKLKKEQKELDELKKLEINDKEDGDSEDKPVVEKKPTTTIADKYKIKLVSSFKDESSSDEDDDEDEEKKEEGRSKGYVSSYQRKLMKKEGISLEEAAILSQQQQKEKKEKEEREEQDKDKVEKKVKAEPQKHLLPSQKNKLKKIKDKYGHQDEEERQERMEILGSAGSKKENKKKDKKGKKGSKSAAGNSKTNEANKKQPANAADKQKVEEIIKLKESQKKTAATTKTTTTTEAATVDQPKVDETTTTTTTTTTAASEPIIEENEESSSESSESEGEDVGEEEKEKRKSRKEKREEKIKEEQEIKRLLEEEGKSANVDQDLKDITNIDTLTGCPKDDDILHFAIPVVAPYSVFNNYKFKVKLTPGHLKRGKAAKQATQVILLNPTLSKREKELIKHVKDEDLTSNMLSDTKINSEGLLQIQKKAKKDRKDKAKEKANSMANEIKDSYGKSTTTTTTKPTTTTTTAQPKDKK